MRRFIVLGTTALALVSGSIARAALPVVDFGAIAQMYQQLQSMAQQYAQLQQTYRAIAHLPANVTNQIGQQLNQFRNPLPSSATTGNMLNGSALNSLAQQYLDRNHVYSSTGTDFLSTEMRRKAAGIASATALANQLLAASQGRVSALQAIEQQLTGAQDEKAVLDISARIQVEHAAVQAAQVQAQSLALMAAAEQRNDEQRQDETRRQSIDNLITQARAHGG